MKKFQFKLVQIINFKLIMKIKIKIKINNGHVVL